MHSFSVKDTKSPSFSILIDKEARFITLQMAAPAYDYSVEFFPTVNEVRGEQQQMNIELDKAKEYSGQLVRRIKKTLKQEDTAENHSDPTWARARETHAEARRLFSTFAARLRRISLCIGYLQELQPRIRGTDPKRHLLEVQGSQRFLQELMESVRDKLNFISRYEALVGLVRRR